MGEALIIRRGNAEQVYEAQVELDVSNIYSTPLELNLGFAPDYLVIIRSETETEDYYINMLSYCESDKGAYGIVAGRSSTAATQAKVTPGSRDTRFPLVTKTDSGVVIQQETNTITTTRKFKGTYYVFAVKYK